MTTPIKLVVIETVITGFNHVTINAGLLEMLVGLNNVDVTFIGDPEHASIIAAKLSKPIKTIPFQIVKPRVGLLNKIRDWKKKLSHENKFFYSLTKENAIQTADYVIFTTITPVNLFLHRFLLNKLAQNKKVIIGLHGEIESIFKQKRTFKDKIFSYFYKSAFKKAHSVKYLVWSDFIRRNLINGKILATDQLLVANHPLADNSFDNFKNPLDKGAIIFSHFGVATYRKSSQLLFELGLQLEHEMGIVKDAYILQNIGKVNHAMLKDVNATVRVMTSDNQVLTEEQYMNYINETHYSLSFISGDEYVNRISGSILDTVQYYKPIIALRHSFIEDVFDKAGDIGFLCDSLGEMKQILKQIIAGDKKYLDRYQSQVNNLKAYALLFYSDKNRDLLLKNMHNLGWVDLKSK